MKVTVEISPEVLEHLIGIMREYDLCFEHAFKKVALTSATGLTRELEKTTAQLEGVQAELASTRRALTEWITYGTELQNLKEKYLRNRDLADIREAKLRKQLIEAEKALDQSKPSLIIQADTIKFDMALSKTTENILTAWEERYNLLTNEFIEVNVILDRAESDLVEARQRYNNQLERNDKLVDELVVADEQMAGIKEELRTAKVQFVKIKSTLTYTTYWEDRLDKAKKELKASNDTLNNWRASALAYREVLNDTKEELTAAKKSWKTWEQAANSHREIQFKLRDELKVSREITKTQRQEIKYCRNACPMWWSSLAEYEKCKIKP